MQRLEGERHELKGRWKEDWEYDSSSDDQTE